jgi:hypothetical protein
LLCLLRQCFANWIALSGARSSAHLSVVFDATVETAGESRCVSFVWTSGVSKVNELPSLLVAGGMLRFDPVLSYARIHIKANALSGYQRVSGERFNREGRATF